MSVADDGGPSIDLESRFFDASIDMLCCLGFDGYFRRLNIAWEQTLGFSRAELMSRPFIEFVHPDDRERTLRQNRDVRGGGQARHFENRYCCKDGSYRWLLWNATPDLTRGLIFSVARDITERKLAELQREATVERLETELAEARAAQALLPVCSYCRRVRDEDEGWHTMEEYIMRHTSMRLSHGICPTCFDWHIGPELAEPESR